jgi:lipoprotein-releasing system permease protein
MTYGLYIGSLGTMAGIVLGVVLCKIGQALDLRLDAEIYFISKLPILIKTHELVLVAVSAMLISFLATIYPAIQASRQNPVDVLRYD